MILEDVHSSDRPFCSGSCAWTPEIAFIWDGYKSWLSLWKVKFKINMWIKWFYFGVLKQFIKTVCLTRDSSLPLPSAWTTLYCFPYIVERKSSLCRAVISLRPSQAVPLWLLGPQKVCKMCYASMSLLQKGKWQGMSLLQWKCCGKQFFWKSDFVPGRL